MKIQKIVLQIVILLLLVFVATSLWAFTFGENALWKQHTLQVQIDRMELEIDSLKNELEHRKNEEERLLKDSFYIESIARTKYGMSKKGEAVYQFIP